MEIRADYRLITTPYKKPKLITKLDKVAEGQRTKKKKGYSEAGPGDSINLSVLDSKTRRGRVGVGVGVANTLDTSCNQGVVVPVLTPK